MSVVMGVVRGIDSFFETELYRWSMLRHVIIDGYNLLGALGTTSAAIGSEDAREDLLRRLASYRQQRGHAITVIFDGWQQGMGAEHREFRSGLEVIYSRRGERADQVIQRLARGYGRDCAVVSSDREVSDFARRQGAFTIGAGEFAGRLTASSRAPTPISNPAVFKEVDDRPFSDPRKKKGNPRKLPKALRKRNRQLKAF